MPIVILTDFTGQEICGIDAKSPEGEFTEGRCREVEENIRGTWSRDQVGLIRYTYIRISNERDGFEDYLIMVLRSERVTTFTHGVNTTVQNCRTNNDQELNLPKGTCTQTGSRFSSVDTKIPPSRNTHRRPVHTLQ